MPILPEPPQYHAPVSAANPIPPPVRPIGKWRLVAAWWVAQAVFIALVIPPYVALASNVDGPKGRLWGSVELSIYPEMLSERGYWLVLASTVGVIIALQLAILLPVRKPRPRLAQGWPLWVAISAAGMCGAVLAGALFAAILMIPLALGWSWESQVNESAFPAFLGSIAITWAVGTPLLVVLVRRRLAAGDSHERTLQRLSATLFKGTLIEAALIIPLDIMVRRKTDCYSGTGTFWGMTLCIGVGLITLGPAVLLPIFAHRHKPWFKDHCDACGYDLSGLATPKGESPPRCPECGAGWRA